MEILRDSSKIEAIIRSKFFGPAVDDMVAIAIYEASQGASLSNAIGTARHWLRAWVKGAGYITYEEIRESGIDWAAGLVTCPAQPDEIAMEKEERGNRKRYARIVLAYVATLPTYVLVQRSGKSAWWCRGWKRRSWDYLAATA